MIEPHRQARHKQNLLGLSGSLTQLIKEERSLASFLRHTNNQKADR